MLNFSLLPVFINKRRRFTAKLGFKIKRMDWRPLLSKLLKRSIFDACEGFKAYKKSVYYGFKLLIRHAPFKKHKTKKRKELAFGLAFKHGIV